MKHYHRLWTSEHWLNEIKTDCRSQSMQPTQKINQYKNRRTKPFLLASPWFSWWLSCWIDQFFMRNIVEKCTNKMKNIWVCGTQTHLVQKPDASLQSITLNNFTSVVWWTWIYFKQTVCIRNGINNVNRCSVLLVSNIHFVFAFIVVELNVKIISSTFRLKLNIKKETALIVVWNQNPFQ